MEREDILNKLNEVFRKTLNNNDIALSAETTANDVSEWDSLRHIMLIVEVEKAFKIKFTAREITSFKNIGEMLESIESKG